MNKLLRVVNVELRPGQKGSFIKVCLLDYRPDVEKVDPRKEKLAQIGGSGLPKDIAESMVSLSEFLGELPGMLGQEMSGHVGHRETASILLTSREYEEMGSPTVGSLLKVDLVLTKEDGK